MMISDVSGVCAMRIGARSLKLAAAFAIALALGACARNSADDGLSASGAGVGTGAPGSIQEFTSSVGDRIFFETDSSQLTPQAAATLDRQATWLARYQQYPILLEGHA